MAQITLKNAAGGDAGTVTLDDGMFGIQPNVPVMHQVVTAQLARARTGTQSTKTRSEVRGGGAKPFRQKGTGNARQGSTNAPHYTGGGIALGPKPRSYAQRTPKKMIKLALRSALSDRAAAGRVVVVESWGWDAPKTRSATAALAALGIDGTALVVIGRDDVNAALSFRNLPEVQIIQVGELNAYDVLVNDWVVFTRAALESVNPANSAGPTDATSAGSSGDAGTLDASPVEGSTRDDALAASTADETGVGDTLDDAPVGASDAGETVEATAAETVEATAADPSIVDPQSETEAES
jgi:large subunit ribosomal protein L4